MQTTLHGVIAAVNLPLQLNTLTSIIDNSWQALPAGFRVFRFGAWMCRSSVQGVKSVLGA